MTLKHWVNKLDELPQNYCIFARKPWSPASEPVATSLSKDFRVPPELSARGFAYFLEVPLIIEVLEVLGDKPASENEKLSLLIFYAENDAYPDWVYER